MRTETNNTASQHSESHLIGKTITVVYEITDPTEWRKTNPMQYEHHGLKAICVSVGDLALRCDMMQEALEKASAAGLFEARKIATEAMDALAREMTA